MSEEIKLHDLHSAVDELRKELEGKSVDQEKVARIEKFLDKYEDENAKVVSKLQAAEQKAQDVEQQMKDAIASFGSVKGGKADERQGEEYKAYFDVLNGHTEKKTLIRTDSAIAGGFLVPKIMENEILKNITEITPMRRFATVRTASSKSIEIPRRLNKLVATDEGEAEAGTPSIPNWGTEQLTMHRKTAVVRMTQDMMLGTPFDMENEIRTEVVEQFAELEGIRFVTGSGVKTPLGFTVDPRVQSFETAASLTLAMDDLIDVSGELKTGYNPWYYMNRRTLAFLRKQKAATTGDYLWSPAVAEGAPATFNGYPYSSDFINMDSWDDGAGAIPVAFADMRMGYRIYDRTGIITIRDEFSEKNAAITSWAFHQYYDGRVVLPEAIKLLKIKA